LPIVSWYLLLPPNPIFFSLGIFLNSPHSYIIYLFTFHSVRMKQSLSVETIVRSVRFRCNSGSTRKTMRVVAEGLLRWMLRLLRKKKFVAPS
jgi:hypothetical protein